MYTIAERLMKERGMHFDLLHPLIAETMEKPWRKAPPPRRRVRPSDANNLHWTNT